MQFVQICVGSSCHLKGSEEIVALFEKAVEENHLENDVVLYGGFCIGECNRPGVTVLINDETRIGVTRDNFAEMFKKYILDEINKEREGV